MPKKIDSDELEKALDKAPEPKLSKEEEIGYHKGAISTLLNERNELVRMVQIVDNLISAHAKRLEELGVKISKN